MQQRVRAQTLPVPRPPLLASSVAHLSLVSPLQDDCRLLALPPGLLEGIVQHGCLLRDASSPSHVAGSCMALMRALLGCEGVRVQLDVTSADLTRCGDVSEVARSRTRACGPRGSGGTLERK